VAAQLIGAIAVEKATFIPDLPGELGHQLSQGLVREWEAQGHVEEEPDRPSIESGCEAFLADLDRRGLIRSTVAKYNLLSCTSKRSLCVQKHISLPCRVSTTIGTATTG
jgi:hypothetical protein